MERQNPRTMLDFQKMKNEFVQFITSKENAVMVLATSSDNRVLARNVLTVSDGLRVYFFTWKSSRKCRQIQQNPNVSFCRDGVHFEGAAEVLGGINDEAAREYTDMFRRAFPGVIEKWEQRPNMVVVAVTPVFATIGGGDETPKVDCIDLEKGVSYSEDWAWY
jgi:general stress protein 26